MQEGLIAAIGALATAITLLAGAYTRAQARNGHGRENVISKLDEIKQLLERDLRERNASVKEIRREHEEFRQAMGSHLQVHQ